MSDEPVKRHSHMRIIDLLPNLITMAAIVAGLTAIRFGFEQAFERAVQLILLAAVLDGLDGRMARLLKRQSLTGAELDSLADFGNFGLAPALIVYVAFFQEGLPSAGWIAVLVYVVCCVLRLARFNVMNKTASAEGAVKPDNAFFEGVPSPAGAILVMVPMYVTFLFPEMGPVPPMAIAAYMVVIGLLMISKIPTYSFKTLVISRDRAKFYLLAVMVLIAALLTYLWATLLVLGGIYTVSVIWALLSRGKSSKPKP
ncbi:CDP-diacylglycerol--serine O-phosphatidyltransferase [Thalassococcus sp. BH17M4-6]|uniref:CDP-diacylglycerol--serine O-phosphatidyltransferase n=1 Tax=Thalassococcus sp. BH17M4-6 TaxID=3413148 RepID=UPI003BDC6552